MGLTFRMLSFHSRDSHCVICTTTKGVLSVSNANSLQHVLLLLQSNDQSMHCTPQKVHCSEHNALYMQQNLKVISNERSAVSVSISCICSYAQYTLCQTPRILHSKRLLQHSIIYDEMTLYYLASLSRLPLHCLANFSKNARCSWASGSSFAARLVVFFGNSLRLEIAS